MVAISSRTLRDSRHTNHGALDCASSSARAFLEDTFQRTSPRCGRLACTFVLHLLARRWSRAFVKAAPRLTRSAALSEAIAAGVALLGVLACRWSVETPAPDPPPSEQLLRDPLQPLREVDAALRIGLVADDLKQRLTITLGADQGGLLAAATARIVATGA